MAQHTDIPREPTVAPVKERDEPKDLQSFLMELQSDREIQVNRLDAREAASAVLCTLARRLSVGEDLKLSRSLGEIGQMLETCEIHKGPSHARRMNRDEFIADVADHLRIPFDQGFRVSTAVFTAIRDRLPEEELVAAIAQLPAELADLLRRPV
ncbi:DUF2267 domain-containing protein [Vitiosangium sp. GDMCC 1.1324]|uniref:DUF2267 domain-containing protein n=1 Tax=Vitiosangium sp. (strain GDMCC 1.1324) TaxID=2138576 RepID=UPI000D3A0E61|nr:DUF2267 domain-containing protein [Vitiosangium sp. GDMCC 1.1324]PTL81032.1 DUF2267 domain-containing protein [Vitiosangium sp. GDMCC 1.1324]